MKKTQKRVAAIHDISGFGRCSLTVALPIISAAGIECSVIPTAVLSTHTGKIEGYTFRDLTSDLPAFIHHWKNLGINYDALYSGYLGSKEQIPIMKELFSYYKKKGTFILIDPVMGDDGALYAAFDDSFVNQMKDLCTIADLITPNMTEVNLFLGESFKQGPYTKEEISKKLKKMHAKLGIPYIVMTGAYINKKELGAAIYSFEKDEVKFVMGPYVEGWFHGTGDMFASALLGAYMNGFDLNRAAQIAIEYTSAAIIRTAKEGTDRRFGVNFEQTLPIYLKALDLI